ncbi:hypothetical protein CMI37_10635 [Candidatus Pacearchaeota archaeon]|jgi:hypothetical protein|nr:hypothetical protein [Candidatus Pacearchaeota archaeon]|tara:strand:- start:562 stop:777 length:216 start_codon:yes stop_codon:yes gene_type:complete
MNERSIVILPEGTDIPEEVTSSAEIIAFLQHDGSVKIALNSYDGPNKFANVNELFSYVGHINQEIKKSKDV